MAGTTAAASLAGCIQSPATAVDSKRSAGFIKSRLALFAYRLRLIFIEANNRCVRLRVKASPVALASALIVTNSVSERKALGKCEGRKSLAEMHPAVVREAKRLGRTNPKSGERRSLRKIAAELAQDRRSPGCHRLAQRERGLPGLLRAQRPPYSAKSVRAMLAQRLPGETPRAVSE